MMKKILLLILLFAGLITKAQFPATQSQGTVNTRVINNGGFQAMKGLINGVFADTTAANADYIDFYNGAQIYTRSDRNFWLRDSVLNSWVRMAKFSDVGSGQRFGVSGEDATATQNRDFNLNGSGRFWQVKTNIANNTWGVYDQTGYLAHSYVFTNSGQTASGDIAPASNIHTVGNTSVGSVSYNMFAVTVPLFEMSAIATNVNRFSRLRIYSDSIAIAPDLGIINIDSLQTTTDTSNFKPTVWNPTTGSFRKFNYWPGGGSGGSEIYAKSVIKTSDSVRLEGENPNEFPPSANKYYGRNSANQPGYHDQLLADIAGAAHGDLLYIDTNGFYATGHVTIKTVPQTRGCVDSTLEFVVDSTLYSPVTGATTFTNTYIGGKAIYVFREEMFQYYGSGFTVSSNTITFGTPLELHERVFIVLKDSSCLSSVALEPPPEDPPVDMDFDVLGSVTESPANQWNYSSGGYAGNSITNMPTNGYVQFEMPSDALIVGLDDNGAPDFYNSGLTVIWKYGFYVASGTMYAVYEGLATGSPVNIGAVGSYTHIRMRRSGTTVLIQTSLDGTTFSTIYTFTPTFSGDLFVKSEQIFGSGILLNPKTLGFE